jgi:short-subunit dehydrogenase
MDKLRGRVALLTGGSRGIGPCVARALAQHGVHLALAARTAATLQGVARELASLGVRTVAVAADITDPSARAALVAQAEAELGPIDILVHNAGVEEVVRFAHQAPENISRIIDTNLTAPFLLSRLVLPRMIQRRCGHIVSIASVQGKQGMGYTAAYSATKAALIEWTGALRDELHGSGVSASVICPGLVSRVGMWASYGKRPPTLARESSPEQVAEAVVRAVRHDLHEQIVNPLPMWPVLMLKVMSPSLAHDLMKRFGFLEFARRLADERQARS